MKNLLNYSLCSFLFVFLLTACSTEGDEGIRNNDPSGAFDTNGGIIAGEFGGGDTGSGGIFSDTLSGEGYNEFQENDFVLTADEAVSTFSIDADGASYANVRRFLNSGTLPPQGAVRTEELLNYFEMDYPYPTEGHLLRMNAEVSACPWTQGNQLLRIGVRGKDIPAQDLPGSNFVFLVDVSGSMGSPDKLELLKASLISFVEFLPDTDRVALVTYSGSSNVILPSTSVAESQAIISAIASLGTGGGTNGAQGIITAYEIAEQNFIPGGNNRLIIGTDGDFNIGVSGQDELVALIEEKRETGVYLSVLGVGTGNLQDGKMEQIANNGNGTYEYLDSPEQAQKVFIDEYKKFYAAAKDVKMQITFNSNQVSAYRLIGYENRLLATEDFEDDTKDAGELGINQTITALYEIVPAAGGSLFGDVGVIDYRYKEIDSDVSSEFTLYIPNQISSFENASENMRFCAATAGYGMLLWGSEYSGNLTWDAIIDWAQNAQSYDPGGHRAEFVTLAETAAAL